MAITEKKVNKLVAIAKSDPQKKKKIIERLTELLKYEDAITRQRASFGLGEIGGKKALKALNRYVMNYDTFYGIKMIEMKEVSNKRNRERWIKDLCDEYRNSCCVAINALEKLDDIETVVSLFMYLPDSNRVCIIARSLAESHIKWLNDIEKEIHEAATSALEKLGDKQPLIKCLLNESNEVRESVNAVVYNLEASRWKDIERAAKKIIENGNGFYQYSMSRIPSGDGLCSDRKCPCAKTVIPKGSGYLYISPEAVNYMKVKMSGEAENIVMGPMPILVCKQGAELRGLDMDVAAADAKLWWTEGRVPLRPTPMK